MKILRVVALSLLVTGCKKDEHSFRSSSPDGFKEVHVFYKKQGDLEWEKPEFHVGVSDSREKERILARIFRFDTEEFRALESQDRVIEIEWGKGKSEVKVTETKTGKLLLEYPSEIRGSVESGYLDVRVSDGYFDAGEKEK